MKKIVIASSNKHKVSEISINIQPFFDTILSFSDFPKIGEIIEDGTTIEENSFIKSRASFKYTGLASVADDTILEVDHLNGEPGLYTARYAGEQATYNQNMNKLIKELHGVEMKMRTARFRTVISYVDGVNDFHVEGILEGKILKNKIGKNGFGYDPIFYVDKYDKSLAQINSSLKNDISHRGLAIKKFVSKIKELYK
ncbi:MAG: RdgB/HAM1 family non-canonical purine NTP pyrophosphatase [Candidatus Marinimicrobia bacterium]|jgi:XTP/dITP diphosphohydrolase|nr:RdgB/HAM1 family non-canonical purine NTP pyrophosphatase [Candidatus Neomarinimicrobiota bacterium]